ncbi:MAG: T9SS type A sorting domain-containing protein, partial [Saprospiraceae bacterium]
NAEPLTVNACPDYASLDTYSSKGADDENTFGENDVWFSFVAPSPANGGPYFNANKSWVTVFLENVTAQNFTMELYQAGGTAIATGANAYSVSSVGDRVWGKFGNLDPGDTYMIRLRHNRPVTEEHQYKIEVNAEGPATGLGACGGTPNVAAARLCGSCGDVAFHGVQHTGVTLPSVESLCEEWYKVDLPEGTPGNKYWVIEVQGYDQVLDFELRSQYITETSANEGGEDDYDHPCTSRNLEPTANIVSSETTTVGYEVTAGGTYNFVGGRIGTANCQDTTDDPFPSPNYGGGRRKVFFGLNGPASGQKDYYYIRVFMDVDDPQFNDCANTGGVNIFPCGITFRGPYDSATEASAGGAVPGNPCALPVDLMSFEGEAKEKTNELTWNTASEENTSHFVVERSKDGKESFEKIGTAEAAGNSVELLSYTFDDEEPLAISYYRLKMVDFDGTYEYSDVISIRRKGKSIGFVNIAPIPTKSSLNISFEIQENTQLSITNMAGQVVRTMELTNENNGTLNLDVSQYAEGVYFMTLSDGQNI